MREETPEERSFADLLNGFSLDSARIRNREPIPDPAPSPVPVDTMPYDAGLYDPALYDTTNLLDPSVPSASIVRAYAWTGGRTTSDYHLEIETMVSVRTLSAPARPEHAQVLELCAQPRSVAEIAALRGLPLGVARVLLGDMASRGLIDVHQTASSNGARPDIGLLERVLTGLRKL